MNYGVEQSFCATARQNTDGDIRHLVSYNYGQDIQCHASRSRSAVFKIPAMTRHGNETIPEGTLDLSQLMKGKQVLFRIPSLQWLKDNEWVRDDEPGPFFVKQLELYPLPDLGASTVTTSSSFSLNKNLLDGEIIFDRSLSATFSHEENFINCHNPPELPSPYDVLNCDKYKTTCRTALGEFGPGTIYPSLIGSHWSVKFYLPVLPKMPYPKTPFYLKVFASICNVKEQPWILETDSFTGDGVCCSADGRDERYQTESSRCGDCPKTSKARLNGLYCESCPAGFEPAGSAVNAYGCRPCSVDSYKPSVGSDSYCQPCPADKFTNNTMGSPFCINRN